MDTINKKINITGDYTKYTNLFLEKNSKLNLISKNDEKFLWEKHIYDSLSIQLFFDKYGIKNPEIIDIGCGGGFPCVPIAIEYPNIKITGADSIRKKINAVYEIKSQLKLDNLSVICDRIENLKNKKYDIVVSRAVADLTKILEYAFPLLKKDGYIVAYKSKKVITEIENASAVLNKYKAEIIDIIEYTLPLDEIYERNLVIVKFTK